MKLKTRKKQAPNASAVADQLGHMYEEAKESEKSAKARADRANESIKALADDAGEDQGKERLVRGVKYEVGYTVCEPSPSADVEKAALVLDTKRLAQITKTVVVIDEKLLEKAVQTGTIAAKELMKFIVPGKPFKRIVCRPVGSKPAPQP